MTPPRRLTALAALLALAATARPADPPAPPAPAKVSYFKDVLPIFRQHRQGCHQPAKAQGSYLMTAYADLLKPGDTGKPNVVPGKPDVSHLLAQITPGKDGKAAMPQGRDPLPPFQLKLIRDWIAQGAADDTPASARGVAVDADHPPVYTLPPVITALDFAPDGQLLAVSGYHEVLLHKADGSGLVARLVGLSERIQAVAFSPDGKSLAAAGGSPGRFGEVQVWDVAKKKLRLSVPVTADTLYGVSWSPDGTKIAFGCGDNTLRAIDSTSGQQVLFQGAHNDWVLDTVFSTDGDYLLSVGRDRSVKQTEVATQRFIDNITSITPGALKGGLSAVALRPLKDRKMIKRDLETGGGEKLYCEVLTGGADGTPRLYQIHRTTKRVIGDDANKLREFEPLPGRINAVAFNKDGLLFAAGSSLDGTGVVRVYRADNGQRVSQAEGQPGPVFAVAFRPDGKAVAAAGFDGQVRLYDPQSGKLIKEFLPVPSAPAAGAAGR
jgi:WD40 repeat protein/mono/diheme cytochrome c family protein